MLSGIDQAKRKRQSRLSDLVEAQRFSPAIQSEINQLRAVVMSSYKHAKLTAGLVDERAWQRFSTLVKMFRARAYRDEWSQNLALAFAPNLYLKHKRRQLGIRPETPTCD